MTSWPQRAILNSQACAGKNSWSSQDGSPHRGQEPGARSLHFFMWEDLADPLVVCILQHFRRLPWPNLHAVAKVFPVVAVHYGLQNLGIAVFCKSGRRWLNAIVETARHRIHNLQATPHVVRKGSDWAGRSAGCRL